LRSRLLLLTSGLFGRLAPGINWSRLLGPASLSPALLGRAVVGTIETALVIAAGAGLGGGVGVIEAIVLDRSALIVHEAGAFLGGLAGILTALVLYFKVLDESTTANATVS